MKKNIALFFVAMASSLVAIQPASAQKNKDKDKRFEEIKSEAQRLMDEIKVPGIAIGIIHDGKVEMAGIGITNVDDPQAVNENTVFYIGSATKPFTATLALKMAERGELDLEAPVRKYLPEF